MAVAATTKESNNKSKQSRNTEARTPHRATRHEPPVKPEESNILDKLLVIIFNILLVDIVLIFYFFYNDIVPTYYV
jgi:hypothetical protein